MPNDLEKRPERSIAKSEPMPSNTFELLANVCSRGNFTQESAGALEQLIKLKNMEEDRSAKRDFAQAFHAMQATMPPVIATRAVENSAAKGGGIRYMFAAFEDIMAQVKPHLDKHGFALSFSTDYTTVQPFRVIVTCTLMHCNGHSESNSFAAKIGDGPPGCSGAQADGAAATYAKRFALCQKLNIVVEGMDDDARVQAPPVDVDAVKELTTLYQTIIGLKNKALVQFDVDSFWKFAEAPPGKFELISSAKYPKLMKALRDRIPT